MQAAPNNFTRIDNPRSPLSSSWFYVAVPVWLVYSFNAMIHAPQYIARALTKSGEKNPYRIPQELGVFRIHNDNEEQIGSYQRNYYQFYRTFYPFSRNGRDYALYSPIYDHTRVMELPSCRDIGGEERVTFGFCPTDYYVFQTSDHLTGSFFQNSGLVAGCEWQDDISWKIQHLDLSEVDKGIIRRSDRFGYIELPSGCTLENAVDASRFSDGLPYISIGVQIHFDVETGKPHWYSIRGDYDSVDAFREK